jgi:hypothetical protein
MVPESWLASIKKPKAPVKEGSSPQETQEPVVHFEIPKTPLQLPDSSPENPAVPNEDFQPKKKKGWKIWIIIILVIIIIAGLGVYFLKG